MTQENRRPTLNRTRVNCPIMLANINFSWALDTDIGTIVHSPDKPIFCLIVSDRRSTRPSDGKMLTPCKCRRRWDKARYTENDWKSGVSIASIDYGQGGMDSTGQHPSFDRIQRISLDQFRTSSVQSIHDPLKRIFRWQRVGISHLRVTQIFSPFLLHPLDHV
jgi:hypothetical protein